MHSTNKNTERLVKLINSIFLMFFRQEKNTLHILDFILEGLLDDKMKIRKQAGKTLNFLLEVSLSKFWLLTFIIERFIEIVCSLSSHTKFFYGYN